MTDLDKRIEIRLVGADIAPGLIRSRELADVITAVEEMITAVVERDNPDIKAEQIRVGLSAISSGSFIMEFTPNLEALTLPAAEAVMSAIGSQRFDKLPGKTITALRTIHGFTQRHDATTEFRTLNGKSVLLAEITPQTKIPEPVRVTGETILYGDVLRVGGAEPKVMFRSISDNDLVFCVGTQEIILEAALHLYKRVGLRGDAVWDLETMKIEKFRIQEILNYEDVGLVQAFAELREVVGEYFDTIEDVNAFVSDIRDDEE